MAIENLTTTRLSNGLPVLIKESHAAPVASFWIFYRVGSRNELPGITGISHWVEHMLFKGSERFPRGEFDKAIARAGGMANGMTSQDWTTYFETLPASAWELALDIEADRMVNSRFDVDEVESEAGTYSAGGVHLGRGMDASPCDEHSQRIGTSAARSGQTVWCGRCAGPDRAREMERAPQSSRLS